MGLWTDQRRIEEVPKGLRISWVVGACVAASFSLSCVGDGRSRPPFPEMDRKAALEVILNCGTRSDPFRYCPALEAYLGDVSATLQACSE